MPGCVTLRDLASVTWAWRATRAVRRQLPRDQVGDVVVPVAPAVRGQRAVRLVLRVLGATCLVRSLVLQEWYRAHGEKRDVVIGVRRRHGKFEAHAWVDPGERGGMEFHELHRLVGGAKSGG